MFAGAAREVVFSNEEVARRVNARFIPVALKAALASIRRQGGGVVEAYPLTSKKGGSQSLWFGTVRMFEREGFADVAPLGSSRLMRKVVR